MVTIGHGGVNTTGWSDGAGCDAALALLLLVGRRKGGLFFS